MKYMNEYSCLKFQRYDAWKKFSIGFVSIFEHFDVDTFIVIRNKEAFYRIRLLFFMIWTRKLIPHINLALGSSCRIRVIFYSMLMATWHSSTLSSTKKYFQKTHLLLFIKKIRPNQMESKNRIEKWL